MKRHFQILLSGTLALVALQSAQAIVTLTPNTGTWDRLKWSDSGNPGDANGGIDASGNILAWPKNDLFRVGNGNDLFEFAVPAGSVGIVEVLDMEANDDGYSVLDFNNSLGVLGSTTIGAGNNLTSIEDDPSVIFGDASWGQGNISILNSGLGGTASFKISRTAGAFANIGGVFVRVRTEVIPEPSSSALMLLGLVGLVARRRRA